jgi:DNA transposition AAA+ family ATPase
MITKDLKNRVLEAIANNRPNFKSDAQQARALGINSAQLSRINKGELEGVLSEAKWITIARKLGVNINNIRNWTTVKTEVFTHIYTQLKTCQKHSLSGLLCDVADIGKSHTAKHYCKENKNAVYIDCSQVKTKQLLVRKIAQEFGVNHTGRYADVYGDLVYYINVIDCPLVVLDEFGDLKYDAFLECKALWNATEFSCGWYAIGADGLKVKMKNNLGKQKVGYTEMFSRLGSRYQKISKDGKEDFESFKKKLFASIAKANGISDIRTSYAKNNGSLRRIFTEFQKQASA